MDRSVRRARGKAPELRFTKDSSRRGHSRGADNHGAIHGFAGARIR